MKNQLLLTLLTLFAATTLVGCSSAGPRKYVFFGDPKPEKVEIFEDYWTDYPFKPDDPDLPLRRGKGGVIRFFKKNSYTRSILVDGDFTVNVYYSVDEGVTLTQPDAQLILSSEELNEKHRKFDKETGYSYHVYLDLGEYDQPEEEITILSVFKDAKTGQATLSKEIRTTIMGSTPLKTKNSESEMEAEAKRWARKYVGDDVENPIAALQEKYSARNKAKLSAGEKSASTRLRETIDLDDSQFEEIDDDQLVASASYLEETQARRKASAERVREENREKNEYYRELRRKRTEEFLEQQDSKADELASLKDSRGLAGALNFSSASKAYEGFQESQENQFSKTADQLSQRAKEEYAKDPVDSLQKSPPKTLGCEQEGKKASRTSTSGSYLPEGFVPARRQSVVDMDNLRPSEMDRLDDFQPDPEAPETEIYTRQY